MTASTSAFERRMAGGIRVVERFVVVEAVFRTRPEGADVVVVASKRRALVEHCIEPLQLLVTMSPWKIALGTPPECRHSGRRQRWRT